MLSKRRILQVVGEWGGHSQLGQDEIYGWGGRAEMKWTKNNNFATPPLLEYLPSHGNHGILKEKKNRILCSNAMVICHDMQRCTEA